MRRAAKDGGVVSLVDPSGVAGTSVVARRVAGPEEAMLAFTKCMKEHGVDVQVAIVTDASGGSGGVP